MSATAIALLACTGLLLAAAAFLTVRSIRRAGALHDLAAMVAVLAAGVPAATYGALAV
jgi:hypothetical protein